MSKCEHIDNISPKIWEAYFLGTILTSEKERVEAFLKQFPEFEEEFKSLHAVDIKVVQKITSNVNAKINTKIGKKKSPTIWWAAAVAVLIGGFFFFNDPTKEDSLLISKNNNKTELSFDTVTHSITEMVEEVEVDDTLFSFERKGGKIKVEEVSRKFLGAEEVNLVESENSIAELNIDTVVSIKEEIKTDKVERPVYEKNFASEIEYRQSVYIEDKFYSASKNRGKTSAYASPIKGYTYEEGGMPRYTGGDEGLLKYINKQLSSNELISGNRRKMRANLSFIVTNKGKVKDVLVQNCNNKQFGMGLMLIMANMPDWSASDFKGKKGKVHYVLKIVFE